MAFNRVTNRIGGEGRFVPGKDVSLGVLPQYHVSLGVCERFLTGELEADIAKNLCSHRKDLRTRDWSALCLLGWYHQCRRSCESSASNSGIVLVSSFSDVANVPSAFQIGAYAAVHHQIQDLDPLACSATSECPYLPDLPA